MSEAKEGKKVTIEEESKMSLEEIFKRCTKHGIVEDYKSTSCFGFKDDSSNDEESFGRDDYNDDYDDYDDDDDESNNENDMSDEDDDDDDGEFGWY